MDTVIPGMAGAPRKVPPGEFAAEAVDIVVDFHGHRAVDSVSLGVAKGEVCAVIGPSGSGKSTLLRTFNHLQAPSSGQILLDGAPAIRSGRPSSGELMALRRKVGMCFQSFNLFPHLTAAENIVLAQVKALGRNKSAARERALQLLDRVGLSAKADFKPSQCSGGQQQRIAIARALALDPEIMLFDEPTSALDPELGAEVLAVMRELAGTGMTMIVVTHEMHFAEDVADHLVFMADGRVVEQGQPSLVLRDPQHERTRRFLRAVNER
ncbi:amino acid ABC transporter ATP-binding protein [Arthrobacter globiformis]|uniref:amino acid ABC transporter ATP-binding protein n=1 Tax=Arthrobacter globiformis TaxID=1665 RepID=UPI00397886A4